jgi:predicted transcriptional regulator
MVRTQIELTDEQAMALREIAEHEGRSVEEVIRQSVDVYAASRKLRTSMERREAAMAIAGRFHSGVTNLGTDHDDYLTEDLAK